MRMPWDMVGQKERPVQETQKNYLEKTTSSWGGQPKLPMLPQGNQQTPYILTGMGQGSR